LPTPVSALIHAATMVYSYEFKIIENNKDNKSETCKLEPKPVKSELNP
jgi:hypothetical protein